MLEAVCPQPTSGGATVRADLKAGANLGPAPVVPVRSLSVRGVLAHLLVDPRHEVRHVRVDAGEARVRALDAPADDAADEPRVVVQFVPTQQWTP